MGNCIRICHLASYFETNRLYSTMVDKLSALDTKQLVVSPRGFKNTPTSSELVTYHGDQVWDSVDKLWFSRKINKYTKYIADCPAILDNDVCHAHSLYSDGLVAYQLYRSHGIPYVITIRNTDLRIFARFFVHLRALVREVLSNASHVIFVNNHYQERLCELLNLTLDDEKVSVIPNGLDSFWFDKRARPERTSPSQLNILSVGNVIKLKNHKTLIDAVNRHNNTRVESDPEIRLSIVGNCNSRYGRYLRAKCQSNTVIFTGSLAFEEIIQQMQSSDVFALLSWRENFGIAYAEAVSQGLPIIYTKGEGFDGWVEEGVWGYACRYDDQDNFIRLALELGNCNPIDQNAVKKVKLLFAWENIASELKRVYEKSVVS